MASVGSHLSDDSLKSGSSWSILQFRNPIGSDAEQPRGNQIDRKKNGHKKTRNLRLKTR